MEEALLAFYLADPGVTAAAAGRVSWSWRAQGSALPAITLTTTDGPRQAALDGFTGFVDGYVQVDCWGALQLDAKTAARAIVAASGGANASTTGGVIQGVFVTHEHDEFEGEAPDRIFRTRLMLRVPYTEG